MCVVLNNDVNDLPKANCFWYFVHQAGRSSLSGSIPLWGWSFIPTRKLIAGTGRLIGLMQVFFQPWKLCPLNFRTHASSETIFVFIYWFLEQDMDASVVQKTHSEQLTFQGETIPKMMLDFFKWTCNKSFIDSSDLYYFLVAPTLCYQRDFPCTPKVRINKLLHRLLEMVSY